jgi:hypothetical protein
MFSTCLFCRSSLGHNDQVEAFPIGRRLAFDASTGRLWVVCLVCRRWNLTPLEERWEAIEWCERSVRGVRALAATDQIALFKLPSGLELVRVGAARWREVAAWRYGRRLWWRHVRSKVVRTASFVLPYAVAPLILPGIPGLLLGGAVVVVAQGTYLRRVGERVAYYAPVGKHRATIHNHHLRTAVLRPTTTSTLTLGVRSNRGTIELTGIDALRVASLALAQVNGQGGEQADIDYAIRFVADAGSGEAYLTDMARRVGLRRSRGEVMIGTILAPGSDFIGPLYRFPTLTRLALEIAAHEASEARALEGELESLIAAWREAEEIARIADNLLVPESVTRRWQQLRRMVRKPDAAT